MLFHPTVVILSILRRFHEIPSYGLSIDSMWHAHVVFAAFVGAAKVRQANTALTGVPLPSSVA